MPLIINPVRTKQCCLCKVFKALNRFSKSRGRKDGYQTACNKCLAEAQVNRRKKIREGIGLIRVTHKVCKGCRRRKSAIQFYVNFQSRDHLGNKCKNCCQHPDRFYRLRNRLRKLGLTVEDYQAMLKRQYGVCALCKKPETRLYFGKLMLLGVDHDHVTGKPRQLLCGRCNYAIGGLEFLRRSQLLVRAIQYLQRHA